MALSFLHALRLWAGLTLAMAHWQACAVDVAIIDHAAHGDVRQRYPALLLRAVLERTKAAFGPYRIEEAPLFMERDRLFDEIKKGRRINITAIPANAEWLDTLPSVPVPIDMGLQSWRLLLIDGKNQQRLQQLAAAGRLREAVGGASKVWVIARVLRANGYRIVHGYSYDGLFHMLEAGRFDYLPRGVHEIFPEFDRYKPAFPALAVETSMVLHARIPALFFVSPQERRLRQRVAAGLEAMLKDGSLERLVISHYRRDLERANLCGRLRIEVPFPALDPALRARAELWFDPFAPRHGLCATPPSANAAGTP